MTKRSGTSAPPVEHEQIARRIGLDRRHRPAVDTVLVDDVRADQLVDEELVVIVAVGSASSVDATRQPPRLLAIIDARESARGSAPEAGREATTSSSSGIRSLAAATRSKARADVRGGRYGS